MDPKKLEWVKDRRRERVGAFAKMFRGLGMPPTSDCLCVGARFGEERWRRRSAASRRARA